MSGFTAVDLSGAGEVTIEQTGTDSLTIEADRNVLPHLTSNVSDGTLDLGTRSRTVFLPGSPINYRLTVKELEAVEVSGSGRVIMPRLSATDLSASISGSGLIRLAGTVDRQQLDISGSGRYDAEDLRSSEVEADISGSGAAVVRVRDRLDVEISGSGSLTYIGEPQVTQEISGSGSLIRR